MKSKLLEVRNLEITGKSGNGEKKIIDDISFSLAKGEILGIVGESGSGKTILVKALQNLLPSSCKKTAGSVYFEGKDIYELSSKELKKIRGYKVSMISDNPFEILDPIVTIEKQVTETILTYNDITKGQAKEKALEIFKLLKMPDPEKMMYNYPHQLSGGMQQRVSIALTLCGDVDLIISDDATRSLDVTIAAQIVELLREMNTQRSLSMLWISHNLPTSAVLANRIMIMHNGKILEMGPKEKLLTKPRHFYTKVLMEIAPDLSSSQREPTKDLFIRNANTEMVDKGCVFANKCNMSFSHCFEEEPELYAVEENHECRCFLYETEKE